MILRRLLPLLVAAALIAPRLTSAADTEDLVERTLTTLRANNASLQRVVLDNGMVCLVKASSSVPVVSVQIWIGTGSIHENAYLGSGISHAIEHMIFKGTATRGPTDITTEINNAGGHINAYTTLDRVVFHTDLPAPAWRTGLDVLADAVQHATFPDAEWAKERNVIIREMDMGKDDPGRVVSKLLWRTSFRAHPYRFPVIGYQDVFTSLTAKDLRTFAERHYVPDNMIVAVVGDINRTEVLSAIRKAFSGFKRKARAPVVLPAEPLQAAPRFARETGNYNLSRVNLAFHTTTLSHPDTPALDVLAMIVGNGRSSRLTRSIKEDLRLVHSISASSYTPAQPGIFGLHAVLDPDKEADALTAIRKHIASWKTADYPQKEIDKALRMLLAGELSELESVKGQASGYAAGEFFSGDPRFTETYLKRIRTVDADALRRVARNYLTAEKETLVILSPSAPEAATIESKSVSHPPASLHVLKNGIRILVRKDSKAPFVYFCAALRGGLLSETPTHNGITRLTSTLLTRGTSDYTAKDIADTIESHGGAIFSFSGRNSFGLRAKCLHQDADLFARLIRSCLFSPSFPQEEINKAKTIQIANQKAQRERPLYLAREQLRKNLFAGHPYAMDPLGQASSVTPLTRADIRRHATAHIVSQNLVIAIFGDITHSDAIKLGQRYFGDHPNTPFRPPRVALAKPTLPHRQILRVPKKQAIVLSGFPGVAITDPRHDALSLLSRSLSGLSSDLSVRVREKQGLVYFAGAYSQSGPHPGAFVLYAGTTEAGVQPVEDAFADELVRIRTTGLRPEELAREKKQMIAAHQMGLQDNLGIAMTCCLNELYGLDHNHLFKTPERLRKVTAEDVRAAAALLTTKTMAASIVLPENPNATHKETTP